MLQAIKKMNNICVSKIKLKLCCSNYKLNKAFLTCSLDLSRLKLAGLPEVFEHRFYIFLYDVFCFKEELIHKVPTLQEPDLEIVGFSSGLVINEYMTLCQE